MRAKISNKSLLRAFSLSFMFVLAVALIVSGFSFTRASTRTSGNANAAYRYVFMGPNVKSGTSDDERTSEICGYYSLDIGNFSVPFSSIEQTTTYSFTNDTTFYNNFYGYIGDGTSIDDARSGNNSNEKTKNSVKIAADFGSGNATSDSVELYAYIRLPDIVCAANCTVEFSTTETISSSNLTSAGVTKSVIQVAGDSSPTTSDYFFRSATSLGGSPSNFSTSGRYIRISYIGTANNSRTPSITVQNVVLTVTVKHANHSANIVAWDGNDSNITSKSGTDVSTLSSIYNTNLDTVGNLTWFDEANGDVNGVDADGNKLIDLESFRTDRTFTKQFSFIVYDYYVGLQSFTVGTGTKSVDVVKLYTRDESPISAGSKYTIPKADLPNGYASITVQSFGYKDDSAKSGVFRGVAVTVVFDGLSTDGVLDSTTGLITAGSETVSSVFRGIATTFGGTEKKITVTIGGLDMTAAPAVSDFEFTTLDYVEDKSGKIWIYSNDISWNAHDADDARDDISITYSLYKKNNSGTYELVSGKTNVDYTINNEITFSQLEMGYYYITFTSKDVISETSGFENHVKTTEPIYFIVDKKIGVDVPETWVVQKTFDDETKDDVTTSDGNFYSGSKWTNQDITIQFNTLSSVDTITYEYTTDNWVTKNTLSFNANGQFVIGSANAVGDDLYGFERTYKFRATYTSGKSFEFEQSVKFDNYGSYKPVSATLAQYTNDGIAYGDILPLTISLNYFYTIGTVTETATEFKGSPMTLYYSIDNVTKSMKVSDNEAEIDIFGGVNVSGKTYKTVKLWFVDEAGNDGSVADSAGKTYISSYNVNQTPAKLYVDLTINDDVKKYYVNDDVVNNGTVTYTLYKKVYLDGKEQTIVLKDVVAEALYDVKYANVNAGSQSVVIKTPVTLEAHSKEYTDIIDKYVLVVNDNAGKVMDNAEGKVIGKHTILKARVTIKASTKVEDLTYNGTTKFALDKIYGYDSLELLDEVVGTEAETWKGLKWKGTLRTEDRNAQDDKKAFIMQEGLTLTLNGKTPANYQLTNASGEVADITIANVNIKPMTIEVIPSENITKTFDGTTIYNFTHNDYSFSGLCDVDVGKYFLDIDALSAIEYSESEDVGPYTKEYTVKFDRKVTNYVFNGATVDDNTAKVKFTINVTPKPVTVTISGKIIKTFDNDQDFGKAIKAENYKIKGLITGYEDVTLVGTNGKTPSVNANSSTYEDCEIDVSLGGDDGNNYMIVDGSGNAVTKMYMDVLINPLSISGVKIVGIYAIDENGNYYLSNYQTVDGALVEVIYKKDISIGKYIAYYPEKTEVVTDTTVMEDAEPIVITAFAHGNSSNGVITMNGQSFTLADGIVYAIEYYSDYDLTSRITSIGALDYSNRDNQPTVKYVKNEKNYNFSMSLAAGTYSLKVTNIDNTSNFVKSGSFYDGGSINITIYDFSKAKYDGMIYDVDGDTTDGYSAVYYGYGYSLKLKSGTGFTVVKDSNNVEKKAYYIVNADGSTSKISGLPINAGTYIAKFTIEKDGDADYTGVEYVLEQKFTILSIHTVITINKQNETYVTKYGADIKANLEGKGGFTIKDTNGVNVNISDGILDYIEYEYSETADFENYTSIAPSGVAGEFYVRVRFVGDNANYYGSVSEPRKIKISGVKFNASDRYETEGTEFSLLTVAELIDVTYPNYKNLIDDFTILYLIPTYDAYGNVTGGTYKEVYSVDELAKSAAYKYMVVHKETYSDDEGYLGSNAGTKYLLAADADGSSAVFYVCKNFLNSTNVYDIAEYGNDTKQGSISSNYLPVANSGEELAFSITDSTVGLAGNYTNGLLANATALGNEYKASQVFKIFVESVDSDLNTVKVALRNKEDGSVGTATITLKANIKDKDSTKLYYYGEDSKFHEVKYSVNGDGTITFETSFFGEYIIADNYNESNNKALAIGLGVGLGAGIPIVIGIAVIIIKKKKKAASAVLPL